VCLGGREKVLQRLGNFEKEGIPPVIQPLFVLAYDAALLVGHMFQDDSDDAILAKKSLVALPTQQEVPKDKKRKRNKSKKLLEQIDLGLILASITVLMHTIPCK